MWSNNQTKHLNTKQISLGDSGISVNTIINEALVSHPILPSPHSPPPPPQRPKNNHATGFFLGFGNFTGFYRDFCRVYKKHPKNG